MLRHPRPVSATPALLAALLLAGCSAAAPAGPTPVPTPGTEARPREIAIIAKDYLFLPAQVELFPGETVLIHVVNGGLAVHEAVIGDLAVQNAWETVEATTGQSAPGPTPVVSLPPGLAGLRVVVRSGERVDVRFSVPATREAVARLLVGCHIPGHWAKGMQVPVVALDPAGAPVSASVLDRE